MVPNFTLPPSTLAALAALTQGNTGMFTSPIASPVAPVAPVVAPTPVVAQPAPTVAPMVSQAPVAAPVASTASVAPTAPVDLSNILSTLNLDAIQGAGGMFGVPGATSSTITNPYTPAYVFNPDVNLVGATDIFGGTTYEAPGSTPGKTRVGYSEMLKLNQTPGFVATNRPEQIGDMYLPYRPSGEGEQVANDIKTWYEYYTDNEDFRKYLSADEQTELAWLDYRNDRYTQQGFANKINDIRDQFGLPKKVGFEDFEAHFSYGTKRKKYSDNPYADLQQYGASIGGYWNPENDPSEFQQAMANPIVNAALTAAGNYLGGPLGAALASGLTTKASGADWGDALTAAALAGGSAYLGGKLAGPQAGAASEFNIPSLDLGAAPVTGFNRALIEKSLAAPLGASAITAPAINLAAPSFFQTALGQGVGKAGLALASGGDVKDALTAGLLGYSGAPGGFLSGSLGNTLGVDLGSNVLSNAVEDLSLANALKFGIKLPEDQWSAVGGLFGDMNLGTVKDTGLLSGLPGGVQNFLGDVQVSDLLSNIGGLSTSSLLNIAGDLNVPSLNINGAGVGNVIPDWLQNLYQNAEGVVQNAYQNVEGAAQDVYNAISGLVPNGLQDAYQNVEGAVQNAYQNVEGAVQDAYQNVEGVAQDVYQNAEGVAQDIYNAVPGLIPDEVQAAYENTEGAIQDAYQNVEGVVQNAYQNAEGVAQDVYQNVEGAVQDAYQNAEGVVQNAYQNVEGAVQNAYQNTEGMIQDLLDKDLIDVADLDISNSLQDFDWRGLLSGLFGGAALGSMMNRPQTAANNPSTPFESYMTKIAYAPKIQPLATIAANDPLSVLLQEFYKTRGVS